MANRILPGVSETMEHKQISPRAPAWILPNYNAKVKMLKVIMLRFPPGAGISMCISLRKREGKTLPVLLGFN